MYWRYEVLSFSESFPSSEMPRILRKSKCRGVSPSLSIGTKFALDAMRFETMASGGSLWSTA